MTRRISPYPVLFAAFLVSALLLLDSCAVPAAPPAAAPAEQAALPEGATSAEELQSVATLAPPDGNYCYGGDPLVISVNCDGDPPVFDAEVRDAACAPFLDVVPDQAEKNTSETGDIFAWDFQVNFDALNGAGMPLACLRLYSGVGETLEPLDGGGILLDTCGTTTVLPEISGGVADFGPDNDATGQERDVTCWLSLDQWLHDPALQDYMIAVAPEAADAFLAVVKSEQWQAVQSYPNFAMLAVAKWDTADICELEQGCPQTIAYVEPLGEAAPPLNLVVTESTDQSFKLGGVDSECEPLTPLQTDGTPAYLWSTVSPAGQGNTVQDFIYRQNPNLNEEDSSQSSCTATDAESAFLFSLSEKPITIGRSPHSNPMKGTVDAAKTNSANSKPPS